ncbi:MAG: quinolinate phosphoribosyl transferase [Clostridiales bacterium]
MEDIRDVLFQDVCQKKFRAVLVAERAGILSGVQAAKAQAAKVGVGLELCKQEGDSIGHNERIGHIVASPKEMAMAEESVIGTLAKASGIATAANTAVLLADGKTRVICGSWKKMPPELKSVVRQAVMAGGVSFRICDTPMIYLDKNYIRMLGSISLALAACLPFKGYTRVIQIRSEDGDVMEQTVQAVQGGAGILMVDTGKLEDLDRCVGCLESMGARSQVKVAFSGNVKLTDIPALAQRDIDLLCIGKEIVDAQLLDMKLDVVGEEGKTWG